MIVRFSCQHVCAIRGTDVTWQAASDVVTIGNGVIDRLQDVAPPAVLETSGPYAAVRARAWCKRSAARSGPRCDPDLDERAQRENAIT